MIAVLLGILKILGLVLLILLGLILLVILLVLLVPVRYRAEGSFVGAARGNAGVSWLLHLVSCQVSYDEELAFQVRVFGFPLRLGEQDEAEEDRGAEPGGQSAETAGLEPEENTAEMLLEAQEVKPRKAQSQEPEAQKSEAQKSEPRRESADDAGTGQPKAVPKETKKRFSIGALCDKLKKKAERVRRKFLNMGKHVERLREKFLHLKEKKDRILAFLRDEGNKKALSLVKRKGFALLRHVLPKKFAGRIRFGFDDPSTTGTVLMYAAPFYGLYARHLELIPDFEETGIEGNVRLSGRIRLGYPLFLGAQLLLNRNFRGLLGKLKKLRQELG